MITIMNTGWMQVGGWAGVRLSCSLAVSTFACKSKTRDTIY